MSPRRVLFVLAFLAAALAAAPAAAISPEKPHPHADVGDGDKADCVTCEFFIALERMSGGFTRSVYEDFGDELEDVLSWAVMLGLTALALMALLGRADGGEAFRKAAACLALFAAALLIMDNHAVFKKWIIDPLKDTALAAGAAIINAAGAPGAAGGAGSVKPTYAALMKLVEDQIYGIFQLVLRAVQEDGSSFILTPVAYILGAILMLAYLFVIGIFTAFMVESLFKFVIVSIIAPLLLAGLPFGPTRAFAFTGLRILLGAALVIVFASGAMGLTLAVVDNYRADFVQSTDNARLDKVCAPPAPDIAGEGRQAGGAGVFSAAAPPDPDCREPFNLFNKQFLIFYVIGFVSILLHLQSKSLASNFSGANDGVGPAAATVAAAKTGVGLAMAGGSGLLFGQGGLRSSVMAAAGQTGATQMLASHGAAGAAAGVAANIIERFRGGPPGGSPSTAPGSGGGLDDAFKAAPGGASAGGSFMDDPKQRQQFANSIGQAVAQAMQGAGGQGGGRNRNG